MNCSIKGLIELEDEKLSCCKRRKFVRKREVFISVSAGIDSVHVLGFRSVEGHDNNIVMRG